MKQVRILIFDMCCLASLIAKMEPYDGVRTVDRLISVFVPVG